MLVIIYERNRIIGNGHYMRCLALKEFCESNYKEPVLFENADETNLDQQNITGNVIIIDTSSVEKANRFIHKFSEHNLIVTMDYFSDVCNPHINFNVYEHWPLKRNHISYTGIEYAIIRKEIIEFKENWRSKPSGKNIFIMIGGNGDTGLTKNIIEICQRNLPAYSLNLIRGPLNEPMEMEASQLCIFNSPANLPELMASCTFAITTPGIATLELLYLNKASLLVPLHNLHEHFANHFIRNNLAIDIFNKDVFVRCPLPTIQNRMSLCMDKVDGLGASRIIHLIVLHYEEKMGSRNSMWERIH